MRLRTRLLCSAFAVTVLGACSSIYPYEFDVAISEDVEAPGDAELLLASSFEPELAEANIDASVPLSEAGQSYRQEGESLNASKLYFFAFVDLDGSGSWEPGEPWGEDPNNPVSLKTDRSYTAEIVVEPDED